MPALDRFYRDHKNDVGILLIANDSSPAKVRQFFADQGYANIPALLDPNATIADTYGVNGFPTEVLIDSQGIIRQTQLGALSSDGLWAAARALLPATTTYTVTATVSGGHGQVAPASQNVAAGGQASITITPESGYLIASVLVDGVSQTVSNTGGMVLTLTNVQAIRQLVVTFSAQPVSFPDVGSSPYRSAIEALSAAGIIGGYANGNFGPLDPVSRQQFAKMMVLTLGYSVTESDVCSFVDVTDSGAGSLYPDNYIAVCAAKGITTGVTASTFEPSASISRAQLMSMVVRGARGAGVTLNDPGPGYYAGTNEGSHIFNTWKDPVHGPNAQTAEFNGLLFGITLDSGGTWSPYQNATRGEVAQILWRLRVKMAASPSLSAPVISSLNPSSGPAAGGTSVIITGSGFTGVNSVTFGGKNATAYTVNSSTQIATVAPSGTEGSVVDVSVTTTAGTSATGAGSRYSYSTGPTLLYRDDFSDTSKWWSGTGDGYSKYYSNGAYVFEESKPTYILHQAGGLSLSDGRMRADVTLMQGAWCGVIFRHESCQAMYAFVLDGSGHCAFYRVGANGWSMATTWTYSSSIRPTGQTNQVEVSFFGTNFTASVNGATVLQGSDVSVESGYVGFALAADNGAGKAIFDNLEVWSR